MSRAYPRTIPKRAEAPDADAMPSEIKREAGEPMTTAQGRASPRWSPSTFRPERPERKRIGPLVPSGRADLQAQADAGELAAAYCPGGGACRIERFQRRGKTATARQQV